jgi:hypothetical protein
MSFPIANKEGGLVGLVPCLLDFSAGLEMTCVTPMILR